MVVDVLFRLILRARTQNSAPRPRPPL